MKIESELYKAKCKEKQKEYTPEAENSENTALSNDKKRAISITIEIP